MNIFGFGIPTFQAAYRTDLKMIQLMFSGNMTELKVFKHYDDVNDDMTDVGLSVRLTVMRRVDHM